MTRSYICSPMALCIATCKPCNQCCSKYASQAEKIPLKILSGTKVAPNCKHWKPFKCPAVYVLQLDLQGQQPWHKWRQRSNIGIYLGQSPIQNRNTALVLHRYAGHVSPQFHVSFDKSFQSCTQEKLDTKWRISIYFERATRGSQKHAHSTTNNLRAVTLDQNAGSSRPEGATDAPGSHASNPLEPTKEGKQSQDTQEHTLEEPTSNKQAQAPPESLLPPAQQ